MHSAWDEPEPRKYKFLSLTDRFHILLALAIRQRKMLNELHKATEHSRDPETRAICKAIFTQER